LKISTLRRNFSKSEIELYTLAPRPARNAAPNVDEVELVSLLSIGNSKRLLKYWQKKFDCDTPPLILKQQNKWSI